MASGELFRRRILTGILCSVFTKLPVALSCGNMEYAAPVASDTVSTTPSYSMPGTASALTETLSPTLMCLIWRSL